MPAQSVAAKGQVTGRQSIGPVAVSARSVQSC